ncbi:hypothetical protein OF83DRAFT_1172726 [Amylostereum chailletii]|nr:hypothetical protein OF83DRAFT_1172726 [Amylostereum chailletii]
MRAGHQHAGRWADWSPRASRLVPFDPKELLYYDYNPPPPTAEKAVTARRVQGLKDFVLRCRHR